MDSASVSFFCLLLCKKIYLFILFIETYLYRVDIISSQAIFHMCPVGILLYEKQTFNYIIYNTSELYNTDRNAPRLKHIRAIPWMSYGHPQSYLGLRK